jgi:hypothetical protein
MPLFHYQKDTMNFVCLYKAGGLNQVYQIANDLVLSPFMVLKHCCSTILEWNQQERTSKVFCFKGNDIAWNNYETYY